MIHYFKKNLISKLILIKKKINNLKIKSLLKINGIIFKNKKTKCFSKKNKNVFRKKKLIFYK